MRPAPSTSGSRRRKTMHPKLQRPPDSVVKRHKEGADFSYRGNTFRVVDGRAVWVIPPGDPKQRGIR